MIEWAVVTERDLMPREPDFGVESVKGWLGPLGPSLLCSKCPVSGVLPLSVVAEPQKRLQLLPPTPHSFCAPIQSLLPGAFLPVAEDSKMTSSLALLTPAHTAAGVLG